MKRRILISFSYIYPGFYRDKIDELMKFTDLDFETKTYLGGSIAYGFLASLFLSVVIPLIMGYEKTLALPIFIALLIFSQLVSYGVIFFAADRKASFAEEMLPDALQLTASHIRSGITPDRALMLAARPEFGSLEREIKQAAREAMTGKPLDKALGGMGERIRSSLISKTMMLVSEGIRSGGELATLMEETAEDIRNAATLRKEVKANVMMYIILIFMASAIGAPVLFATTTFLVESISDMGSLAPDSMPSQVQTSAPIKFAKSQISVEFMIGFAIATIITSGIFGGLILGLIESGSTKEGLKYIPLIVIIGLIIFSAVRSLLGSMFAVFFI